MTNKEKLLKLDIRPVDDGRKRRWLECKECKKVFYHDYIPFGIGTPITWLPCGHSIGMRFDESVIQITESKAICVLQKQLRGTQ